MKLKTKKNLIEAERKKYEAMAREIGVTNFQRDPNTGNYLNWGTTMDWRIWLGATGLTDL